MKGTFPLIYVLIVASISTAFLFLSIVPTFPNSHSKSFRADFLRFSRNILEKGSANFSHTC